MRIVNNNNQGTYSWTDNDHTHDVYRASLAFAILAWIVNIVALVFMTLGLLGILTKIPLLPTVTKFLPLLIFFFSFLSFIIFLGLPRAMKKDCETYNQSKCYNDRVKQLIGSDSLGSWHPIQGWACAIIASAFSLGISIISILLVKFDEK
ncbi:hypothetical protein PPL_06023 [Heterostelium album PN500]|uniref:Uncharacterized protein n=1 Tax=Heterostelium pallidum (strain ATCC 26659 / Pp 5 / PN500) TaxID=670386 RepID=D3BC03_HETP5|nr:hypothetical protein PPL_06023 [Heterostelium album PN500]EFA81186.1 hypothetical protein PPL_06023 [Heterostelium album PN500]|eukprot:XP_020433304.1 hypothetical protein PPL_06023 [Heterostelium album PN500]